MSPPPQPHVVIIAGPNGAGKSTLAPRLLMQEFGVYTFVNADIVAQGLAAFDPASAAVQAGRVIHRWIGELRAARVDFAFETTLAGLALRRQIAELRGAGYVIHLVYLWLPGADAAVERVRGRVRVGGHAVPDEDVRRRYDRGLRNFLTVYRQMASDWLVYDATRGIGGKLPPPIAVGRRQRGETGVRSRSVGEHRRSSEMNKHPAKDISALIRERTAVDRAVGLAAQDAVRLHRRHGVPLVSWRDGRVVYVDPWEVPLPEDEAGASGDA